MSDQKGPGQPTKYKQEYCEQLIEHMAKGYSYESFAAIPKVHKGTLYDWEKANTEWKDAKELAFAECQLFWEKLGIDNIVNTSESEKNGDYHSSSSKSLNGTVWIFNMINRFQWRNKQADEVDTIVNNGVANMSDDALDDRIKKLTEGK